MRLLECCLDVAAQRIARWALRRFADRVNAMRSDEQAEEERQQAAAQAQAFARTLCNAANLPQDEPMLRAMPVDAASDGGATRFCPWAQTTSGCPLLREAGSCPMSHNMLPTAHVTWDFRCWAQSRHQGWIGQRAKIG